MPNVKLKIDPEKVITDFRNMEQLVDHECNVANNEINLGAGLSNRDLRDHMMRLSSLLGTYNEYYDKCRLMVGIQRERVERAKDLSMQTLLSDDYGNVPATLKKELRELIVVEVDGVKTTYNEEKVRLNWYSYSMDRFKSTCDLLETNITTCQSALNYDKEEYKKSGLM